MRILVEQSGYQLLNLGDIAMLQVTTSRLIALWPDAQLMVMASTPDLLKVHCPGTTPLDAVGRSRYARRGSLFGSLGRRLPKIENRILLSNTSLSLRILRLNSLLRRIDLCPSEEYIEAIKTSDLVVTSGGGYMTDAFPGMVEGIYVTFKLAKNFGKPYAIMGQGIGPLKNGNLLEMTREILANASLIALREGVEGIAILKSLGIAHDKVVVTGDDAIETAYERRKPTLGSEIGVNLRPADYANLGEDTINKLRCALQIVRARIDASFVPLPVSLHDHGEDAAAIRSLISTDDFPSDGGTSITTPIDLIGQVGRCRVVITGSYHAAVFALSQGIPVVCLARSRYYFTKFTGLADQFGEGCQIIDLDESNLGVVLPNATEEAWQTAEETRPALLARAQAQIRDSIGAYRRVYSLIERDSMSRL